MIALALAPLAFARGVPAFEQDWQWPVHHAQCAPYTQLGSEPWNSGGIGTAQSYPEPWIPYLAAGTLCSLAGPHLGLLLYLTLLLSLASLGIIWLGTQRFFSACALIGAAALYLGNPVLLNKIHAGHLHFIFSYAMLAVFLAALSEPNMRRNWLWLGLLLGLASAQQQFFFFAVFLGFVLSCRYGPAWFVKTGFPCVAVALCFTAPQWILGSNPASAASFAAYRPTLHWEQSQSVALFEAVRFLGYIGGYDKALSSVAGAALWLFPALALLGAAVTFARKDGRSWVAGSCGAVLIVTGFYGPLAPIFKNLVDHAPWAIAPIRELYNFEAIAVLCYAILTGIAIDALQRRSRRLRAAAIVVTVLAVIVAGVSASFETRGIASFAISETGSAAIDRIAAAPGLTRYLPVPSILPQSAAGSTVSGLSPFGLPIGNHASALDSRNEMPYSQLASSITERARSRVLEELAVSSILTVPDVRQVSNYEPQLRTAFPNVRPERYSHWAVAQVPAARLAFVSAKNSLLEAIDIRKQIDLNGFASDVNPARGWARTALWNNLPPWIYERPAGIFTTLPSAVLTLPPDTTLIAGTQSGHMHLTGCRYLSRLNAHFSIFECGGTVALQGRAGVAASEAFARGGIDFIRAHSATVARLTQVYDRRWVLDAMVDAEPGAVLVTRERFDPGWRCEGCDAMHVRADGFSNAWLFERRLHKRVRLVFEPGYSYYAALALSAFILISGFSQALILYVPRPAAYRRPLKSEGPAQPPGL